MGVSSRRIGSLAVLAALLVPVLSALLPHPHATAAVSAAERHDARQHLCGRAERLADGVEVGCPVCLSQRVLSQSLLALGRQPDRSSPVGFVSAPAQTPSVTVRLRTRPARAPPHC